ncbi:translation initiation factor IF-2 [Lachnospiraceae bacterium KH1T2]|nr:translation initiation factor IF-2 [Lachnospiraceae bacterium KH1T2]
MAKMQIMKITKELKDKGITVSNKDVVEFLKENGADVSSHMSSIDDKYIKMVREKYDTGVNDQNSSNSNTEEKGTEQKYTAKPEAKTEVKDTEVKAQKKSKHNIIVSTNNNGRGRQGNRQVVKITNGKIEDDKPKKKVFKHTEVASPEAFAKTENKVEEQPVKQVEEVKAEPVETKAEKAPEAETQSIGGARVIGNVFENMERLKKEREAIRAQRAQNADKNGNGGQNRGDRNNGRNNDRGGRYNNGNGRNNQGQNKGNFNRNGSSDSRGGRSFGNGGNNPGFNKGNGRPGSNSQNTGNRGGFSQPAAPAPTGKESGNRRGQDRWKQNEARKRKEQNYENSMEEKSKKFNPHGFHKPAPVAKEPEEQIKVITIPDELTIRELADHMKMQPSAIIKKLFLEGKVVTLNTEITYEEAEEIALGYEILCEHEKKVDVIAELLKEEEEDDSLLEKRPPVVCVMGHVDHGKTSLLDKIRQSHVTAREAGGITQAIGAYVVNIEGKKITFLDTPGHEAFTAMRMRGANSTDIAILVVAADDGVMPQTVEAINHAKAAGVDIIVAVNKMDKPNANIDRVKQELAEYELIPEDWGGSTVFVPVSAKTGDGIDTLLEMCLLSADMLELKANPNRKARGLVIEARLDKGRGPVTTILVQKGTLRVGDFIAVGQCHGRVRAMLDENGKQLKEAGPSTPAEILGLDDVPDAGEIFVSPETDKEAKNFAETFKAQHKKELLNETKNRMSLDDLYSQIKEGELKEFNVIIKADVQGSVEALKNSLLKLSNEEVALKVIHGGVGAINESDVILASASNAIIIGFNVRPDNLAKQTADTENVDIRLYKVIYQAIDDVEAAMKGMLAPVYEEKVIGHAEIRQIFKASAIGNISGSYVTDGVVERGCSVRIFRGDEKVFEGELKSLKRFKDDVKEVKEGYECGLVFEGFDKVQELDRVECYKMVEVERK